MLPAANSHGQLKFHVALLNKYFSTHFRPLTESPHIVDNITGHHRVLRDIHHIRETHPWFQSPPGSEEEEEVGMGGEIVEVESDAQNMGSNITISHDKYLVSRRIGLCPQRPVWSAAYSL